MPLTPTERDRLLLFTAAEPARARHARGLRLNVPEATALIADTVREAARDGLRLAEAVDRGRSVLGPDDVLPGVVDVVTEIQVEAVFDDGTRLAAVAEPFGAPERNDAAPGASQIATAMCDAYGASKVIWFDGIYGKDITDDHVDATSRFLAPGAALVQMPLATDTDAWARDARQQYNVLTAATTATGGPIDVTPLQGPDYNKIRSTNRSFLASYANYYLCNGAVISGQFGDTRADDAARAILARLYPDRIVEQLDIDRLGTGGGGIHCVTQQQPAV